MAAPLISTGLWDVRPTVGSDTNGGGFDTTGTGTNFSQQNSKNSGGSNSSTTDLTTTTTGSFTSTSAGAAFTTAITGNYIYLAGGTGGTVTTGWYRVTYVSPTQINLDRSPGAAATLVTMNIGGAMATISAIPQVANNVINVKNTGNYTVSAALTVSLDSHGAPGNPFSIIGYTTTPGDGGQFTWTTSTNTVNLIEFNQSSNVLLQNIIFSNTAGSPGNGIFSGAAGSGSAVSTTLINCKFTGFLVGVEGNYDVKWAFSGLFLYNCRFTSCSSHGVRNGSATFALGCIFDNNTGDGFNTNIDRANDTTAGGYSFTNCFFYKNGANGFNLALSDSGGSTMEGFSFTNCAFSTNIGAGFITFSNVTNPLPQFNNCIFDANGTYGIDAESGTTTVSCLMYNNSFYSNGTAATRNCNAGIGTITLTASPYVSLASLNFALNSTSGGGPLLANLGFPGILQVGGTGFASVGPLAPAGGGVSTLALTIGVSDYIAIADT